MLLEIIKKSIDNITLEEIEMLYNTYKVATIKVADNQLTFIQE